MKKTALFLFFLFTLTTLFSQEEKLLSFGLEIGPQIVTQIFEEDESVETNNLLSGMISGNVYLQLSPQLMIKSGLSIGSVNLRQKDYSVLLGCDSQGPGGGFDVTNSYVRSDYSNFYLGIPIAVRWNFVEGPNTSFIRIGQELLFEIGQKSTNELIECGLSTIPFPETNVYHEFSDFIIVIDLGVGYEFGLSEKIKLYFEPTIAYSANPFLKSDDILPNDYRELNKHMVNYGINLGLRF